MDDPSASQGALTGAAAAFARQRAVMAVTGATAPEMHVLLVLAVMANEDAQCWPAIRGPTGLVAKTVLGERTIARALRGLEAKGHITTQRIDGKGSIYTVHPCHSGSPATAAALPQRQGTPATAATKQPMNNHKKKETSSLPSTRAAAAKPAVVSAIDLPALPAGASEQQWADYVEMRVTMSRADKKRPWTATVARKAIEKLHALAAAGNDPGAVLDQSVLNLWQGLFPVKDDRNGRSGRPGADAMAGPRRGYGADMLAAAHARPPDDTEGDPRDSGGAQGEVPAWLRRRP